MNASFVIYKITSSVNGKFYIGSTFDYEKRTVQHLRELRNGKHHSKYLQNHVNKYGIDVLTFSIVEMVMFTELLKDREQYYIDTLKPKFNMAKFSDRKVSVNGGDVRAYPLYFRTDAERNNLILLQELAVKLTKKGVKSVSVCDLINRSIQLYLTQTK